MVKTILILFIVFLLSSVCIAQDARQNTTTENRQQEESIYVPVKRTLKIFKTLKKEMTYAQVEKIVGEPDTDVGSGIFVFVYNLSDGSRVLIGFVDLDKPLRYVKQILPDGNKIDILSNNLH